MKYLWYGMKYLQYGMKSLQYGMEFCSMEWDFSVWESPCACTLTAQSGDEAGLCLFVSCVHCLYLHAATHDTRQPLVTVDTKSLEVGKQTFVPVYVVGGR